MIRKRKNPKDEELLTKLTIKKIPFDFDSFLYQIYLNNKEIGYAYFNGTRKTVSAVDIKEKYQRKGVATYLYNYIEQDQNVKLKPDREGQSIYGQKFWENRMKRNPIKRRKNPNEYYMIHFDEHGFLEVEKGSQDKLVRLMDHYPSNMILDKVQLKELFNILESYV